MYRARLHRYLWKYLKRQPASEKAVYLRYVTRKTIPNPRPRQMGILCHAPLRLSIYLFRSNAGIFLLKSFVAMNNGTCPTVRDRTATCKVCFPRDRQIITFQSSPRSRQDLLRDPGFSPRYVYTFVFLVHQESPFSRTTCDISLFKRLSSTEGTNFCYYYLHHLFCNHELMWKEIISTNC